MESILVTCPTSNASREANDVTQ